MNKKVQRRSVITFILSIVAMIVMVLLGGKTTAQEAGGSELSLDNVTITSFKIIDVNNGNRQIDYRTSDNAQFNEYNSDPTKFNNALNEGQKKDTVKLKLSVSYSADKALTEGDTLTIPASIGAMNNFSTLPLKDSENHELGTWEYRDGNVVIHFAGDYIKNNKVSKFDAIFETGENTYHLSGGGQSTKLGERRIQEGKLGKERLIVAREKQYIQAKKINDTNTYLFKLAGDGNDSEAWWQLVIKSDVYQDENDKRTYYNPHLLENDGAYSPKAYTDIYLEDTFTEVIDAPELYSLNVWISGTDDDGNVISGDYVVGFPKSLLTEVKQGSHTKEELKALLEKGQYAIYDNKDGTYTFMLKWWDMNGLEGPKYDDLPQIKSAGGVGSYLKKNKPEIFGSISETTVTKINNSFKGKAIQNVFMYIRGKYKTVLEKTAIPNTLKIETAQTGKTESKATAVLTPSAGSVDAPADPLSIKLLKADAKTGKALSEGFKFELQTSDDNGTTWKAVNVKTDMVVSGTLNGDNTLTPNEKGTIEVNSLVGGKKYRFFEKAHADGYKDVTEDNANPNTTKTPTAANSRVVEISNQGTGKVIVMYNQQKPETVKVEGTKTWDDADNQDSKRPAQITVNLLKNGQKVASKTVTEADGWKWTFDNLEKSENGKDITYTVEEEAVEGYTSKVNGFNITNTYTPTKTSVQVTKKWDDADDKDGKRPTSVTITLYANGEKTDKTLVLNKENNWTGSFTEVDEYKAGKKIDYSVQEEPVGNGYVSEISGDQAGGFTVTNTRKPDAPVTTETPTTTPVTTTTEEGEKELPNTGTTGSLAVIGFLALIGVMLVLTVKNKKA
nr:MAG TPA: Cna protein B-type domain [Caudoviricetes sp.]